MIRAVLFDMDGTLLDTETHSFAFHEGVCRALGLTLTRSFFAGLMGRSEEEIAKLVDKEFGGRYEWLKTRQAAKEYKLAQLENGTLALRPGTEECLRALQAMGIKIGLVTSTEAAQVKKYIAAFPALQNCFDAMIRGSESPLPKPSPVPFLLCAEKLGLSPAECMGVEDGAAGLRSIRAAGMTSVFVPDFLTMSEQLAPYVDYELHSLAELPQIIRQRNQA